MPGRKNVWSQTSKRRPPVPCKKAEVNTAPSQWGRRLARRAGEKFGVQMVENHSKNLGLWQGKCVILKCAKSETPPVSVLETLLDRVDELWAIFLMPEGHAEVWAVPISIVRQSGYLTRTKEQRRVEITLKKVSALGQKIGTLTQREVEACQIP
jgi:hypothetical protein